MVYHVRNSIKSVFVFAEHQEKATIGLGFQLPIKIKSDNIALTEKLTIQEDKEISQKISRHVTHYIPSLIQQEAKQTAKL